MLELVRRNLRFFIIIAATGLLLRLIFLFRFPGVVNDSFIYGDIAKNWLQHGVYGLSGPDEISPTYIRLPGYPAFLAFIFAIFGKDHYRAVLFVQMFVDLGTCCICADLARRLFGLRSAKTAFVLAALCPFLADYSAAALTETLEIFFTALALDFAVTATDQDRLRLWTGCGLACGAAILLRPDGVLLLIAIAAYLVWKSLRTFQSRNHSRHGSHDVKAALLVSLLAISPLAPWTLRNWIVFHRFQPLAPRYANEEGEFVPMGFNHWTKTWIADYTSVEEIYWPVPGSTIDPNNLPSRAFDSAAQRTQTASVIEDYNKLLYVSPELDSRFEAIATARIRAHRARNYLWLPLMRITDMWLRPRTEMLPCDSRWWEFNDERRWSALAVGFGVLGLLYVITGLVGMLQNLRIPVTGLLVLFVTLRSLFLGSLENPEPRYTLEMYPVVIVFAAAALLRRQIANRKE